MAAFAIAECLGEVDEREWSRIPLILCVAERERPCRLSGLDDELLVEVQRELGVEFSPESAVIPHGRVGAAIALRSARGLIASRQAKHVLIAAADSLVSWPTLSAYERQQRLLTPANSNGFIPGEGAGALLIGDVTGEARVICSGLGFAEEPAHINSEEPLRAGGLTRAIGGALEEAGLKMHELDFRITDVAGEQYYFKEATLALSRLLRARKEEFDIWHPAECIGECGALAGLVTIVVAFVACQKSYSKGDRILCHASNDNGMRAAAVLHCKAY
jgi:3-oxoacyl-[acyl-carrier-protein] synthase-1